MGKGAAGRGTLAQGAAAPVVELKELFRVLGVAPGRWRELALCLARARYYPDLVVVDTRGKRGRPKKQSSADLGLVYEVNAFRRLYTEEIRNLDHEGYSVEQIAHKTSVPAKQA